MISKFTSILPESVRYLWSTGLAVLPTGLPCQISTFGTQLLHPRCPGDSGSDAPVVKVGITIEGFLEKLGHPTRIFLLMELMDLNAERRELGGFERCR